MQCVILAGGLATRLRPITETIPKSMVLVHGIPFLQYQLDLLKANGIVDYVLCVGFLGEQIEEYFKDGTAFGVHIRYSYEEGELLGTGGALRNAADLLKDDFFVMYGDSYLDIDYRNVYAKYHSANFPALMTVFKNAGKWDTSNVIFNNNGIAFYDKNNRSPEMHYIDYGLSVLTKQVVCEIPENTVYDLSDLYHILSVEGRLGGYEVCRRFYEIGSKSGLKEFSTYILDRK